VRAAGAHVMGRATYEQMAAFWPSAADDYAAPMKIPKVVFSTTLERADWPETRIVRGDLARSLSIATPPSLTTKVATFVVGHGSLQHYFDSRGVARVYEMTIADRVWTLQRLAAAPDFSQRFTGTFDDDDNTIVGRWEISSDSSTWNHDFDLTYKRLRWEAAEDARVLSRR
jgi:dihydrofolate reductase